VIHPYACFYPLVFRCMSWKCETLHFFYPFVVIHQKSFIQGKGIQSFELFANLCRYETSGSDDYSLEWLRGTRGRAEFLSKSPPKGKKCGIALKLALKENCGTTLKGPHAPTLLWEVCLSSLCWYMIIITACRSNNISSFHWIEQYLHK
jgi:hypothetical protein